MAKKQQLRLVAAVLLLAVANVGEFLPAALACSYCPTPTTTPPPPPPRKMSPPPQTPCPPPPKAPATKGGCPIDTLKLDACVDVLGGLVHAAIGQEAESKCCPVIQGLADLDAALCLCTTIKAKALQVSVVLPVAIELLIDCGKHVPADYKCPA